jgi:hypothetical protein
MPADTGVLEAMLKRIQTLQGLKDSRGPQGILSRGANVYNGGSLAAQRGGGLQYGRYNPLQDANPVSLEAIRRKLYG